MICEYVAASIAFLCTKRHHRLLSSSDRACADRKLLAVNGCQASSDLQTFQIWQWHHSVFRRSWLRVPSGRVAEWLVCHRKLLLPLALEYSQQPTREPDYACCCDRRRHGLQESSCVARHTGPAFSNYCV